MEKVCLVDGNNLMFRSYYATAYTGNMDDWNEAGRGKKNRFCY